MKHKGTIGFCFGVFIAFLLCQFNPSSIKHADVGVIYQGNSYVFQLVTALDIESLPIHDVTRVVFILLLILSFKGRFLIANALHKVYVLLESKK